MKTKVDTQHLGLRQLASRKRVGPSSISSWVAAGCPRNPDGTFSLADVDAWLRERADKRGAAASLRDQKIEHEIQRLKRDIDARDIDISKLRGEVHSKRECAASLTALRARESRTLHGLAQRFSGAFPEATAQAEWLDKEVNGVIERLGDEIT